MRRIVYCCWPSFIHRTMLGPVGYITFNLIPFLRLADCNCWCLYSMFGNSKPPQTIHDDEDGPSRAQSDEWNHLIVMVIIKNWLLLLQIAQWGQYLFTNCKLTWRRNGICSSLSRCSSFGPQKQLRVIDCYRTQGACVSPVHFKKWQWVHFVFFYIAKWKWFISFLRDRWHMEANENKSSPQLG